VDGHFRRFFRLHELCELHGSLYQWQCAHPDECSHKIWPVPTGFRMQVRLSWILCLPQLFIERFCCLCTQIDYETMLAGDGPNATATGNATIETTTDQEAAPAAVASESATASVVQAAIAEAQREKQHPPHSAPYMGGRPLLRMSLTATSFEHSNLLFAV
jgi:hypothetical protein